MFAVSEFGRTIVVLAPSGCTHAAHFRAAASNVDVVSAKRRSASVADHPVANAGLGDLDRQV
jgi:hypothetical protein